MATSHDNLVKLCPIIEIENTTRAPFIENITAAKWTEWSDWQNCFCGKQIRTRVCQYDDPYLTKGCSGKSYESRPCDDMENCPTTRPYSLKYATKVPYLPSTRRQEQPFKSNFLSIAVKKTDTIVEPVTA